MPQHELTLLRHTDYCCHGCWQDLRLLPQARWRMVAVPVKARGSQARGEHLLAVCEQCAWPVALAQQAEAPSRPEPVLDREDASLTAGALGLLSGWFLAGPVCALLGLAAGVLAGWVTAKRAWA